MLMPKFKMLSAVVICLVLLGGVGSLTFAADDRKAITYDEMLDTKLIPTKPVSNSSFMAAKGSESAKHSFAGGLALTASEMSAEPEFKSRKVLGKDPKIFPGVTLQFFSYEGDLIPLSREIITPKTDQANNSFWEILVSPGKIWSEPGDKGWSRASFPFALMNSLENETHNGIATFLFNESEVSTVRFQIVQQTTPYYLAQHFVAWGQIPATYDSTPIADKVKLDLAHAYGMEKATRFPAAEWSVLEQKVGKAKLAGFEGEMDLKYLVLSALVYDGVLYYKPSNTKYGNFPYIRNMRMGVWSMTKSVGAGIAILRLAEKYGTWVFNLKIKDYVNITADHEGWEEVTFGDALNMATGIGGRTNKANPNDMYVDYEFSGLYDEFYRAHSAQQKIALVSKVGHYVWGPGEVARYRDRDMFMLGAAMDGFLKKMEGPKADIWNMVAEEVLRPIHVYHAPVTRTIEPDGSLGLPITAWGWLPTLDDLAKIADLLHSRGLYNGQQILHAGKTSELFSIEGSLDQGRDTAYEYGARRYKMSFHYVPFRNAASKLFYLPYMSGWIGNKVVLMPGNMTAIRISKAWPAPSKDQYVAGNPTSMIEVGNKVKPF